MAVEAPVEVDADLADGEAYVILLAQQDGRYMVWRPQQRGEALNGEVLKVKQGFAIRGSSEGLVCVESENRKQLLVGNPVTKAWSSIPACTVPLNDDVGWDFLVDTSTSGEPYFVVLYDMKTMAVFDSRVGGWKRIPVPSNVEELPLASNMRSRIFVWDFVYDPVHDKHFRVPSYEELMGDNLGSVTIGMEGELLCSVFEMMEAGTVKLSIHEWKGRWEELVQREFDCGDFYEDFVCFPLNGGRYIINTVMGIEAGKRALFAYDQLLKDWYTLCTFVPEDEAVDSCCYTPNKRKLPEHELAPQKKFVR